MNYLWQTVLSSPLMCDYEQSGLDKLGCIKGWGFFIFAMSLVGPLRWAIILWIKAYSILRRIFFFSIIVGKFSGDFGKRFSHISPKIVGLVLVNIHNILFLCNSLEFLNSLEFYSYMHELLRAMFLNFQILELINFSLYY